MANIKIYKRHFLHFRFLPRYDLYDESNANTQRHTHTNTAMDMPLGIGEILHIFLKSKQEGKNICRHTVSIRVVHSESNKIPKVLP